MKSSSILLTTPRARGERPVALARFDDVTRSVAHRGQSVVVVEHDGMLRARVRPNDGGAPGRRQSRGRSSS